MFSQTTEYALRAMVYLTEHFGTACGSEQISVATQVPKPYLSKILRDLVVGELISSTRGPHGGFLMTRSPDQITILDVVSAVDPIKRITACPLGRPDHKALCPLHRQMDAAIAHVEASLRSTTLKQLVETRTFAADAKAIPARRKRKKAEST